MSLTDVLSFKEYVEIMEAMKQEANEQQQSSQGR
jgi:hypothetical protein